MNLSKSKRIIVIEDDPYFADMLKIRLNLSGYRVLVAQDGLTGMQKVKSLKPDLVILDLKMPSLYISKLTGTKYMDIHLGIKICRMIKHDKNLKHIPVLMLTNSDSYEDIESSLRSGVNRYMLKTEGMDIMTREVDEMLGVSSEKQEALAAN